MTDNTRPTSHRKPGYLPPNGLEFWSVAHEGASALVRGAFMGVRNLVSHPGWPDPNPPEALEMLAVLSYVARLADNSDRVDIP